MHSTRCSCPHHFGIGVLVLIFGLVFLLQAMGTLSASAVSYTWPILVIILGAYKLIEGWCRCGSMKQGGECGCGQAGHTHTEHKE